MTPQTDVGWRHRKRHCASWHSTLTKLTLPHDANSVVQNKKGTKTKTKEENPKHAQRELGTIHAADYTAVFSCCLCVRAVASFCS